MSTNTSHSNGQVLFDAIPLWMLVSVQLFHPLNRKGALDFKFQNRTMTNREFCMPIIKSRKALLCSRCFFFQNYKKDVRSSHILSYHHVFLNGYLNHIQSQCF